MQTLTKESSCIRHVGYELAEGVGGGGRQVGKSLEDTSDGSDGEIWLIAGSHIYHSSLAQAQSTQG